MSSRRKEMWKLLYNLVNRNDANLMDVCSVVDEILCQEPSLISCASLRELSLKFQDTFMLWLLNKFAKCLSESTDKRQCLKNVELQQKILTSCWANHPKLYEQLVIAYVNALEEITMQLSAFAHSQEMYNNDINAESKIFHLNIFTHDITCLLEFDPQCALQTIELRLNYVDAYAKQLLDVLQHAHHIGYSTHGELFVSSLKQALLTLRECDMDTKLACLTYCHDVFQAQSTYNWISDAVVVHYALLTLRALSMMWSMASKWLTAKCMSQSDLLYLSSISCQLLVDLKEQPRQQDTLDLSCEMLRDILQLHVDVDDWRASLLGALIIYLQQQMERTPTLLVSQEILQLLLCHWRLEPAQLLALLAVLGVKQAGMQSAILGELNQNLNDLLGKNSHNAVELNEMVALLQALKQMEQLILLQEQEQQLANCSINEALLLKLPQHYELPLPNNWNQLTLQHLDHWTANTTEHHLQICSLLLQVAGIRVHLKPQTQQQLLGVLQETMQKRQTPPAMLYSCLQAVCAIKLDTPSSAHTQLQSYYAQQHVALLSSKDEHLTQLFCNNLPQLYVYGYIKAAQLLKALPKVAKNRSALTSMLRLLLCTRQPGAVYAFRVNDRMTIYCDTCQPLSAAVPGIYQSLCKPNTQLEPSLHFNHETLILIAQALLFSPNCEFIAKHLDLLQLETSMCLNLLKMTQDKLHDVNAKNLEPLVADLTARSADFMQQLARHILGRIMTVLAQPLDKQNEVVQQQLLQLLVCCAYVGIDELWLFHWFKMSFYFLMHGHSLVAQEAVLAARQMCAKHGLQTLTLWNWYKRDALSLVVELAVNTYLSKGVRITRSLRALTKMLGFSCVQEFICKYHRLLTTIILPYCIREPRCKGIIVLIAKQLRKPIPALFTTSFLRLYTHVYLTESAELANSCIKLTIACTKSSLPNLMNADVKQTVAELLIYFNRNPTFITRSFQCLLQTVSDDDLASQSSNAEFAKFIAERFLGVITHFESCLSEPSFEKPLKEETLYSLGQIMRFVGPQHVTHFRFKIIAMLSFVHTLQETNLQRICLKIWRIFLHVVNVQELGPSLGRIVATLQPLLAYDAEQVNSLYEFVILRNASMLGSYITDLYFLERLDNVSPAIRECIVRHTAHLALGQNAETDKVPLLDQLRFLHKQITNECLQVRVYGLEHLEKLLAQQRTQLNHMILHELPMEPLLEKTINVLMDSCQHDDRQLQLAAARCLGELGAIDASYLPSNYNFAEPQQLPLSVLTDDFAVLALTALCRNYQFQQKTKHVDSFSLAIQETLAVCGISPKEQKKLQLWQSLPARMRQLMEPLLESCYTSTQRPSSCEQIPIFGSHYTHNSYEVWAFIWAARLVDYVQSSEARHLLSSYKPCIKRDGNMLSTFYPYILLHALLECSAEQRQHIEQEFLAVLHAASENTASSATNTLTEEDSSSLKSGYKTYDSKKYAATVIKASDADRTSGDDGSQVPRLASKLCAELLDFLQRWLCEWQRLRGMSTGGKPPQQVDSNYRSIYEFLQRIDKLLVARASYNCGEYARALSYLEAYIEDDKATRMEEQFSFLVELYGRLMDADSVEGAVQMRCCDMSVTEEILVNRLVDRQQDMITCYEQLLSSTEQMQPEHIHAIVDAYLRMDTPKTALLIADGLWQRVADDEHTEQYFSECKSELLWRLGSYDELDELQQQQQKSKLDNWHAQCAQACLALRQPATTAAQFATLLDGIRGSVLEQLRSCSAMQQHSYAHASEELLQLHLLHELQGSHQLVESLSAEQLDGPSALAITRDYFGNWQARLQLLQPQVRVLEPVYSFRRNLLTELQRRLADRAPQLQPLLEAELARLWLSSAQINRDAGQLQRSQLYIMKAAEYKPSGLFLERAKLLWQKGDQVMAMHYLEEQLAVMKQQCAGNLKHLEGEQRQLYFEGKYLQATYNAESMHLCADAILKFFQEAIAVQRQSERCHVQLAQFLEKMREARPTAQQNDEEAGQLLLQIMVNYGKSLCYGSEHVYQSMPRLISLWLDTAACGAATELVRKMNDLVTNCCKALPTAMFYTVYSQLLSRLCHPLPEVYNVLRDLIVRLIQEYPHQSLWMLLPHFKSAVTNRIKRCKLVLTDARLQNSNFQRHLSDFNTLTERLIELTNKDVALDRSYKLSELDKRLPRMFNQSNFSNILLPFEKYMQPTVPIGGSTTFAMSQSSNADASQTALNWFPSRQIYINGFKETVVVLRSAAKPKKLTICCSDGNEYDVMVKPKDDLRKDARLMEFNGLVKRYLHQNAQARQRRLRIRTYAVLPFNEECGLLEWLPNLKSYRSICNVFYAQRGQGMGARQLQQLAVPTTDPLERKRQVFIEHLLPSHPAVFQEWFQQRFSTPHSWYEARNAYIRTVAVMSMVGYILGLGDRHGENILLDEHNGDAVHVDFNCLFNQGEAFAFPELVPFRLTHNMIAAMGPLGVEGSYRKCCEITLRLLRQETKTLMSVLRPFVYDLGVQSKAFAAATSTKIGAELTDPKATNDVQRIAQRLQGHVKRNQANSIPLSTEGQVNFLINEAIKLDNLAAMYIGWGAFL